MRVSNQMLSQMLSNNILENQSAVYNKEQQISSGKRIQRASDDPVAWAYATRLKDQQGQLAQYARNSDLLEFKLVSADHVLSSIGGLLQNASEIAVQASDGTLNAGDRTVLARQVDQLLEQLLAQANSKFNGQYQFGGVRTETEPFVEIRDDDGRIASVSYAGGASSAGLEIAEGDVLPSQFVGDGILGSNSSDAFSGLIEMRDRLLAGENLADTSLQGRVDAALENVIVARAMIGAYQEHLTFVGEIRGNHEVVLMEGLSAAEGIDVAKAISVLAEKQLAYQAALAMATQTSKMSLLNYL